jgi:hypothetical protein
MNYAVVDPYRSTTAYKYLLEGRRDCTAGQGIKDKDEGVGNIEDMNKTSYQEEERERRMTI